MIQEFKNIDEILDFAIKAEQESVDFYNELAKTAANQDMKSTFESFAREEMGHKANLLKVKETGINTLSATKVNDLKIAEYTPKVQPKPDMTYAEALVLAMSREKAAFKLYSVLASRVADAEMSKLFTALAMEESRHKLRFELEYDEYILKEN